jgi:hypothetical protein
MKVNRNPTGSQLITRQLLGRRVYALQSAFRASELRDQQPPRSARAVALGQFTRLQVGVMPTYEAHDADAIPSQIAEGAMVPIGSVIVVAHENI